MHIKRLPALFLQGAFLCIVYAASPAAHFGPLSFPVSPVVALPPLHPRGGVDKAALELGAEGEAGGGAQRHAVDRVG